MKTQRFFSISLLMRSFLSLLLIIISCSTQQAFAQTDIKTIAKNSILDLVEFKVETNSNQTKIKWHHTSSSPKEEFIIEATSSENNFSTVLVKPGGEKNYNLTYSSSQKPKHYRISIRKENGEIIPLKIVTAKKT